MAFSRSLETVETSGCTQDGDIARAFYITNRAADRHMPTKAILVPLLHPCLSFSVAESESGSGRLLFYTPVFVKSRINLVGFSSVSVYFYMHMYMHTAICMRLLRTWMMKMRATIAPFPPPTLHLKSALKKPIRHPTVGVFCFGPTPVGLLK